MLRVQKSQEMKTSGMGVWTILLIFLRLKDIINVIFKIDNTEAEAGSNIESSLNTDEET